MPWEAGIRELEQRRHFARQMGGPAEVERQHGRGKLTIRERIERLLDPGSFEELGSLAGQAIVEDGQIVGYRPAPYVMGLGRIDGRPVVVGGEDFTIKAGSGDGRVVGTKSKMRYAEDLAYHYRIPLVLLLDGAGANVKSYAAMGATYLPSTPPWTTSIELLNTAPVVAGVLGSIAGLPAGRAATSHWSCMVKETSQIFAAGPPVVRRAIGENVTKEELGGYRLQVHQSGVVENVADTEDECLEQIRRFLSYMPQNAWELPPYKATDDPPDRREEGLLAIIPENSRRPYDMRKLIGMVVDCDSFFEIQPFYGQTLIVGFARMNGHVVGVWASNPMYNGGAMDGESSDKQTHFIELCDFFHIPMVNFVDLPGFMVGVAAERSATLRRGMRAFWMAYKASVPLVTVVVRKCFGMAGAATSNPDKLALRIGWPSGYWGSLPIEGGVDAAFRREIESAPDPDARRAELEAELRPLMSPWGTGETFGIEEIIDPRDTRRVICTFLDVAVGKLKHELGPKPLYGVRP